MWASLLLLGNIYIKRFGVCELEYTFSVLACFEYDDSNHKANDYKKLLKFENDLMIKIKLDNKASELWVGVSPPASQCKKCIHACEDTTYTIGAQKANCDMYESPYDKPPEILQDKIECEFFEKK